MEARALTTGSAAFTICGAARLRMLAIHSDRVTNSQPLARSVAMTRGSAVAV